jgi:hypothetical protein
LKQTCLKGKGCFGAGGGSSLQFSAFFKPESGFPRSSRKHRVSGVHHPRFTFGTSHILLRAFRADIFWAVAFRTSARAPSFAPGLIGQKKSAAGLLLQPPIFIVRVMPGFRLFPRRHA